MNKLAKHNWRSELINALLFTRKLDKVTDHFWRLSLIPGYD
jgi:hypothetical protein